MSDSASADLSIRLLAMWKCDRCLGMWKCDRCLGMCGGAIAWGAIAV